MWFNRNKKKKINTAHGQLVDSCMDWCFFHAVQELRSSGYDGQVESFPDDIKTSLCIYMLGVGHGVVNMLENEYEIQEFRPKVLARSISFVYNDDDKNTGIYLAKNLNSLIQGGLGGAFMAGESAINDILENYTDEQSAENWLNSYKGMFGAYVNVFIKD